MDNSFNSIIESANSLLILLPTKPYFDQVAAGLSLYLSLKDKKELTIYSPSEMLVEFNRLVGVNKVTNELGNKNLVIRFADYDAVGIERVSYDIENGEFRLSVIPKQGLLPPKKEQIDLSYSGLAADTVILIGGANESHFPSLASKDLQGTKIIHIGTRQIFLSGREVMSLAKPLSSVSELVAGLIKESGLTINEDLATNLIQGIEVGSNHFSSEGTSVETFQLVADLLRAGGKRHHEEMVKRSFPPGSVPGTVLATPQEEKKEENAPQEWLAPKIYKGTSVS